MLDVAGQSVCRCLPSLKRWPVAFCGLHRLLSLYSKFTELTDPFDLCVCIQQCLGGVPQLIQFRKEVEEHFSDLKTCCTPSANGHPIRLTEPIAQPHHI